MNYNIPSTVSEIFAKGETSYSIVDYGLSPMDNNESMRLFLDLINASEDDLELNDGTLVFLKHKDYAHLLRVDAGGLGDHFSHLFEVSIYNNDLGR